jgi:hypothetical protein
MGWVGRNDMCARRDAAALRWCRDDCTTLACTLACRAAGKSSNEEEGGLSNGKTRSSVTAAPRHLLETETRGRPSPLASCEAPRHPALRVDGGGGLRMAHQPQHAERCRRPPVELSRRGGSAQPKGGSSSAGVGVELSWTSKPGQMPCCTGSARARLEAFTRGTHKILIKWTADLFEWVRPGAGAGAFLKWGRISQ